jgi:hypothetical protein
MGRSAMQRYSALLLLVAVVTAPPAVGQQLEMRVVTLLSEDKAMVDATPLATKEIVSYLASQAAGRPRPPMITVRNCQKVPADTIQALTQDLQKRNFIVALDFNPPDSRLCSP